MPHVVNGVNHPSSWPYANLKLVCFGDSTTQGTGSQVVPDTTSSAGGDVLVSTMMGIGSSDQTDGYRSHLMQMLIYEGKIPFDIPGLFVGAQNATSINLPRGARGMSAHPGTGNTGLATAFPADWAAAPGNVIAVSAGINDFAVEGKTVTQAATAHSALLDVIIATAPGIPILDIGMIPGSTIGLTNADAYSVLCKANIAARVAAGVKIITIDRDCTARIRDRGLFQDGLHPNWWGYRIMAMVVKDCLDLLLV